MTDIDLSKMIFSNKRLSTKEFLKNQTIVILKHEEEIYKYAPKILTCIFDKIYQLHTEQNIAKLIIYESFSKLQQWSSIQEEILKTTINFINNGEYNFSLIKDINILVELLYDWLNKQIMFVINPKKVMDLNEKTINAISKFLERYTRKKYSRKKIKYIVTDIKKNFSAFEVESLISVAWFCNKVAVDHDFNLNSHDEKKLATEYYFHLMIENIALRMMGYQHNELFLNNVILKDKDNIIGQVNVIVDIVIFFVIVIHEDYKDINTYYSNKDDEEESYITNFLLNKLTIEAKNEDNTSITMTNSDKIISPMSTLPTDANFFKDFFDHINDCIKEFMDDVFNKDFKGDKEKTIDKAFNDIKTKFVNLNKIRSSKILNTNNNNIIF